MDSSTTTTTPTNIINCFSGYEFKDGKNMYRGTDIGYGGYIYSNPGCYKNVVMLDVASMHPTSIITMNCFGEYTKNFEDLLKARIAIKHGDYESARTMLGGRLAPYLTDESKAKDLAQATKIALNSCYGLTAANFETPMRDVRNKNNIVALKGALTMRTLQDEVESRGFKIVAIRTDSIKIADATKEIIEFCINFVAQYGYTFEVECVYDRICQINDADYIAKYKDAAWCEQQFGFVPGDNKKHGGEWTATGKQFQIPYVFKTLFSKEPITFEDLCETKEVKTAIYIDMNENLTDVSKYEKELDKLQRDIRDPWYKLNESVDFEVELPRMQARIAELENLIQEGEHDYHFVGKVGNFCPIKPGCGGGVLVRESTAKDGTIKYDSVTGTLRPDKIPYRWLESEVVKTLGKEGDIDKSYYRSLADKAIEAISEYTDFERFVSDEPYGSIAGIDFPPDEDPPWYTDDELDAIAEAEKENLPYYITSDLARVLDEANSDDAFKKR